ncbi:hypothetical protein SynA15127_01751 [Synechococcus sp. A15-127]|nr:hypothetical protein SynA15127_01751 [Synechococcus sp. A15-127]
MHPQTQTSQQTALLWTGRELKRLLEHCSLRRWASTSALMEAHDIRMCRRSSTR